MKPTLEYIQDGDKITVKGGPGKDQVINVGGDNEEELPSGKMAKVSVNVRMYKY